LLAVAPAPPSPPHIITTPTTTPPNKKPVYGSLDFDRDYVADCHRLIAQLRLERNVALRGLGAPLKVLASTWIYIQTSISEGLPVSVIEAGLTGKCVVATDVGGCAELLANPESGRPGASAGLDGPQPPAFGRLVAPRDAAMVAYAQLEALAFLPTLHVPKLLKPPDVDLAELKRRIHDPAVVAHRQALGRLFRGYGLQHFRMARYVLQHRQALFGAAYAREAMAALGGYEAERLEGFVAV
jgi:glycosyltransferase involved in cell wall biosynthesis